MTNEGNLGCAGSAMSAVPEESLESLKARKAAADAAGDIALSMKLDAQCAERWRLDNVAADKALRRDIDAMTQFVKSLPASRERAITIVKLQEAVMWLGMDLKRLGTPNPYPTSKDPSSPVVEPTADGLKM